MFLGQSADFPAPAMPGWKSEVRSHFWTVRMRAGRKKWLVTDRVFDLLHLDSFLGASHYSENQHTPLSCQATAVWFSAQAGEHDYHGNRL